MRSQIVLFVALVVSLFNGVQLSAQSQGPPAPGSDRTPGPPIDASMPIDDNIVFLLIAGLVLGVYFVYTLNIAKKKAV